MANPVTPIAASQLPPISSPLIDPITGLLTLDWYRYLLSLYQRTGGSAGTDVTIIQQTADAALALATIANALAVTANHAVATVSDEAASANATAIAAFNLATQANNAIGSITNGVLFAAQNLADLANLATARSNLGVDSYPIVFQFDNLTSASTKVEPMIRNVNIPINFGASNGYCMTVPTSTVVMSLNRIRAGVTSLLGTISFTAGGHIAFFSPQPLISILGSDIITLASPSDVSMAGVGITINAIIG